MADTEETGTLLTSASRGGILERRVKHDTDGFLSFWYTKNDRKHRRVLARIAGSRLLIKDPATGKEVEVGKVIKSSGVIVIIF